MARPEDTSHLRGWKIVDENPDPGWSKYWESLFTLGNGYLGTRGAFEEAVLDDHNSPLTLIAEVYDKPDDERVPTRSAPAPNWLPIEFDDGAETFSMTKSKVLSHARTLDMKRGTLTRHARIEGKDGRITSIISTRLVSMARPHIAAIAYSIIPENYSGEVRLTSWLDGTATYPDELPQLDEVSKQAEGSMISLVTRTRESGIEITEAARHTLVCGGNAVEASAKVKKPAGKIGVEFVFDAELGKVYTLEKVVAIDTSFRPVECEGLTSLWLPAMLAGVASRAQDKAASSRRTPDPDFTALEKEHAAEWGRYWRDCDIKITGDRFVQTMARFWVFQLLQAASENNVKMGLSASIPAKTLSGPGYAGHIFWDTEIYMLPFFSQQYPEIAKSLLGYRYDRLETAKQNAIAEGNKGAKFPWESAGTGVETTPKWCGGVRCWTGEREIHVTADVAFGCWQHYLTTGDEEFLLGPALEIILESARYWSTRAERTLTESDIPSPSPPKGRERVGVRRGPAYHYEISEVIGPDENHECVNNSVFTNAMARWNIRKAMELLDQLKRERPKVHKALVAAHSITDAELHQWADVADSIRINFDPDTVLYEEFDGYFDLEGKDRDIKQADVLLMLHLLPELRTTEIFRKNFEVYYPVTRHGSSLSPAVHVLFALDIGYKDHAYDFEIMTCSLDGTRRITHTDPGLHAASLGGGWSSIVAGFGGVRVMPDHLSVSPDLLAKWKRLEFSMTYRGLRLRFRIEPDSLTIQADPDGEPVDLEVRGSRVKIKPGERLAFPGDGEC